MKEPRMTPWHLIASMAYWEQVGVKRHVGGSRGEIRSWYALIRERKKWVLHFCRKSFINLLFPTSVLPSRSISFGYKALNGNSFFYRKDSLLRPGRLLTAAAKSAGFSRLKPFRTVITISMEGNSQLLELFSWRKRLSKRKNSLMILLILFLFAAPLNCPWILIPSRLCSRLFGSRIRLKFSPCTRLPRR